MFYLFQTSSQSTVPLWLTIVLAVIAASGTWVIGFVNRKRRSSVRAEDRKHEAETRNLEILSIGELLDQSREMRAEITAMAHGQAFLRDQVRYHEELTIKARQAAHAAINEMQRCYVAIYLRDEALREAGVTTVIPAFEQKEHDEIVKYQEFPLPPDRRLDV